MSRQPIQHTEFAAIDVTLLAADAEERLAQLIFAVETAEPTSRTPRR